MFSKQIKWNPISSDVINSVDDLTLNLTYMWKHFYDFFSNEKEWDWALIGNYLYIICCDVPQSHPGIFKDNKQCTMSFNLIKYPLYLLDLSAAAIFKLTGSNRSSLSTHVCSYIYPIKLLWIVHWFLFREKLGGISMFGSDSNIKLFS